MKHLLSLTALCALFVVAVPNASAYTYNYNTYQQTVPNVCNYYQNGRCIRYTSNRYVNTRSRNSYNYNYNYNYTYPTYHYANNYSRVPTYTTVQPAGQYRVYDYNDYYYNTNTNYDYYNTNSYYNVAPTYDYYNTYDSYYRW